MNALQVILATVEPGVSGPAAIAERVSRIIGTHATPQHHMTPHSGIHEWGFPGTPFALRVVVDAGAAAFKEQPVVYIRTTSHGMYPTGNWQVGPGLGTHQLASFYAMVKDLVAACRIPGKTERWRALQAVRLETIAQRYRPSLEAVGGLHDYLALNPMGNNVVGTVEPHGIHTIGDFFEALESKRLRMPARVQVPRQDCDYEPEYKDDCIVLHPVGRGTGFRFAFPSDYDEASLEVRESSRGARHWSHVAWVPESKLVAAARSKTWLQALINSLHTEFYDA